MNAITSGYGQVLKCGARVAFDGRNDDLGRVTRWHANYGDRANVPGYVPVKFDDGSHILAHASRLSEVQS